MPEGDFVDYRAVLRELLDIALSDESAHCQQYMRKEDIDSIVEKHTQRRSYSTSDGRGGSSLGY